MVRLTSESCPNYTQIVCRESECGQLCSHMLCYDYSNGHVFKWACVQTHSSCSLLEIDHEFTS